MGNRFTHILKIVVFAAALVLAFWLAGQSQESIFIKELVSQLNYLGVFIMAVIGGLNLVVPVPSVVFMPLFLEAGLNFWIVIFTLTGGMLLADGFAWLLGKTGRQILISSLEQNKILNRLEKLKTRNEKLPYIFLFLFASFAPLPNEVIVIPMGFLGYKIGNLLTPLILGNFVFNTLFSIGATNIFNLLTKVQF